MVFCDKEFIGKKIKEFRKKSNLTQAQLAEKAGISETHISKIEIGSNAPSIENFLKIAEILNLGLNEFGINIEKSSDIKDKFVRFIHETADKNLKFYYNIVNDIEKFKRI